MIMHHIKRLLSLSLILIGLNVTASAEQAKSEIHQRAESVDAKKNIATARSLFIHAFNDYAGRGQVEQGVVCATKATALYYKENFYKEAFDLLRRADQTIVASKQTPQTERARLHYLVTKERLQMYIKLRKSDSARDQLKVLESLANASDDEATKNDLLYTKAIYHYTFGQTSLGNAVFKEMASKLTAEKEYDKVDKVYQTLIANSRASGSAGMVAQSYSNYMSWKDSVMARQQADTIAALQKQIADGEAVIADKDSSLTVRQTIIVGLSVIAIALAAALAVGAIVLLRFIALTRKQKKNIQQLDDSNAQKAQFISNISAQLEPTLSKLDPEIAEVKALLGFTSHVATLSDLENNREELAYEDTQMPTFCEKLIEEIRPCVKNGVILNAVAPKMSASINREYVTHIMRHLLENAAQYTPAGGRITIEFKKRGPHSCQLSVTDTGTGIAEELRDNIFTPFREAHDLTTGDGLGLPICKKMAEKMNGELVLDTNYTKGASFVLSLHT